MPTLKKLKEDKIKITSKLLKKDKDFSPISPEFIKDLKDKTLLENSALKLSINDYKLMCNDDEVLHMMSITLNKTEAKLKKFCKFITVFEENINLSPKSIARKINGPICSLPENIRSTILDKFAEILPTKYVLLDWIDENKLNWTFLSQNLNAIDLLEKQINIDPDEIHWYFLSQNPNAIELLKKNKSRINWRMLSMNPNAIELLKKRIEYENRLTKTRYNDLGYNDKIDWSMLSTNSNAIDLLLDNKDKIDWVKLSKNPKAIELLKEQITYENKLSRVEYDKLKYSKQINWYELSANPNAIELLTNNQDKIDWDNLSRNPNAIDLLLDNKDQIDWCGLSQNPNAIEILKKNKRKIHWDNLSRNPNPNAIELLRERIEYEYENKLSKSSKSSNSSNSSNSYKIDWNDLSINPNTIELLKENQDKIDWVFLSENPAIFKAV